MCLSLISKKKNSFKSEDLVWHIIKPTFSQERDGGTHDWPRGYSRRDRKMTLKPDDLVSSSSPLFEFFFFLHSAADSMDYEVDTNSSWVVYFSSS